MTARNIMVIDDVLFTEIVHAAMKTWFVAHADNFTKADSTLLK